MRFVECLVQVFRDAVLFWPSHPEWTCEEMATYIADNTYTVAYEDVLLVVQAVDQLKPHL